MNKSNYTPTPFPAISFLPGSLGGTNEELGTIGIRSSVSHGENTRTSVLQLEVLILKPGRFYFTYIRIIIGILSTFLHKWTFRQFHSAWWSLLPGTWSLEWHGERGSPCSRIPFLRCKVPGNSLKGGEKNCQKNFHCQCISNSLNTPNHDLSK